jgi:hypothetical protein
MHRELELSSNTERFQFAPPPAAAAASSRNSTGDLAGRSAETALEIDDSDSDDDDVVEVLAVEAMM